MPGVLFALHYFPNFNSANLVNLLQLQTKWKSAKIGGMSIATEAHVPENIIWLQSGHTRKSSIPARGYWCFTSPQTIWSIWSLMALWTQYGWRLWDQELKVLHSGSSYLYLCKTQTFKIHSSLKYILSRFFYNCNTGQISGNIQRTQHSFPLLKRHQKRCRGYKDPWSTRTKSAPGGTKTLSVLGFGSDSHMQWCVLDSLFIFYCSATDGEIQIDHHGVDDKMMGQELQRRKLLSC